jgi:DNA-binding transcriptional ArsR family regulator
MGLSSDETVDALRAAGEPTRLRILSLLAAEELSVMVPEIQIGSGA